MSILQISIDAVYINLADKVLRFAAALRNLTMENNNVDCFFCSVTTYDRVKNRWTKDEAF